MVSWSGCARRTAGLCSPAGAGAVASAWLPSGLPLDEALRPADRLHKSPQYLLCYRKGRRRSGRACNVHFLANDQERPRLGVTASRKVGPAVVRNRLRRRVREIFRRWPDRLRVGHWDLVVHLNTAARTVSFEDLQTELLRLLRGIDRGR